MIRLLEADVLECTKLPIPGEALRGHVTFGHLRLRMRAPQPFQGNFPFGGHVIYITSGSDATYTTVLYFVLLP